MTRDPDDQPALRLDFRDPVLPPALSWFCEPPRWEVDAEKGRLVLATAAGTDFWQRTHYGFEVDNGHALMLNVPSNVDFTLATRVHLHALHQYDQAGLMIRVSSQDWLKTSIEYEPEGTASRLGAVVTQRGFSDWSTQDVPHDQRSLSLRISVKAHDCMVEASTDEGFHWSQIRLARLNAMADGPTIQCGLYACSPKDAGFVAEFEFLEYRPAAGR